MDIFAPYEQAHRQEGEARQRMEEAERQLRDAVNSLMAQRQGRLARTGVYARVRHPQYIAFVLIMFGFLLQWPTLLTLLMLLVLVVTWGWLAISTEAEPALLATLLATLLGATVLLAWWRCGRRCARPTRRAGRWCGRC